MQKNKQVNSMTTDRRTVLKGGAATVGLAAATTSIPFASSSRAEDATLNWLTWAGHSDPAIIGPFEEATGIKIKAKEYAAGDLAIVEISQNPGLYDIVTVAGEYVPQFVEADILDELDPEEYDGWSEYLPEFRKDLGWNVGGKFQSVLYEFGFNGLAYRTDKLSEEDVSNSDILLDPRLTGKVATNDWWGNAMGTLSIAAGFRPSEGRNPYIINDEEFEVLRQYMTKVRPQFSGFLEYAGIFSGFSNGSIWVQPGGGDWAAQILLDQGVPMGTAIPKEGGYLWSSAVSLVSGSTKSETAKKFVNYLMSAEAQARIATKGSYSSIIPNARGWEVLQKEKPDWAKRLNLESVDGDNAITPWREGRIATRALPKDQTVKEWGDLWQEFKNL